MLAFGIQRRRFRHRRLHLECEFVAGNARAEVGIARVINARERVQFSQQAEAGHLLLARRAERAAGDPRQRPRGVRAQPHAGMLRTEIARAVRPRAAAAVTRGCAEHDVLRQVGIHAAEAVAGPRSHRRQSAFPDMPARVPCELRAVVVVLGPERAHHGEIIRASADMREPVAHHESALAVVLIAGVERHDDLAVLVRRIAADDVLVCILEHAGVRRFLDAFAAISVERGLHIEALHMAQSAAEEDPDDRLRPRLKMRLPRWRRPHCMRI